MASTSSEHTVRLAARAALGKKAAGVAVLDLQGISGVADFFLVCSAQSSIQIDTIADAIQAALKAAGVRARHREGTAKSGWLLLDYGDVVVHVFAEATPPCSPSKAPEPGAASPGLRSFGSHGSLRHHRGTARGIVRFFKEAEMRKERLAHLRKKLEEKHRQLVEGGGKTVLYAKGPDDDSNKDLGDQA